MAGKRDKPEEIMLKLRQVEMLQGQGGSIADAVRQIGVTQPHYEALGISERRACRTLGQHRSTQRKMQDVRRSSGRRTADRGHHRADARVRALRFTVESSKSFDIL